MATVDLAQQRVLVITASDRCASGTQVDLSGPAVAAVMQAAGAAVERVVVADEVSLLVAALRQGCAQSNLVLTTGGTGLAERDVTPEATLAVCDRMVPGLAEVIRREGERETPFAALGRGVAGVCGNCLVINLPGSPRGAVSAINAVLALLPHALDLLRGETGHQA